MKRKMCNIISLVVNCIIIIILTACVISFFALPDGGGVRSLNYFTVDSNIYLALTSIGIIILNIFEIKNEHKKTPKWFDVLRFTSVVSVMVTFFVVVCYLGFIIGFRVMYSGSNFFLHLVNPALGVLSYIFLERHRSYKFWYAFYGLIPVLVYGTVYLICVFGTHVWGDFYHFNINGLLGYIIWAILIFTFFIGLLVLKLKQQTNKTLVISKKGYNNVHLDAITTYMHKIYRFVIIMSAIAAFLAAITFTICKAINEFENVSNTILLIFDFICTGYLIAAVFFVNNSFNREGLLKPARLKGVKIALGILVIVQWNLISYMFPSTEFWAYAVFFVLLTAFLFDYKLVLFVNIGIIASTIISWIINGDALITQYNIRSVLILRGVCLILSLTSLQLITYFGGEFLVKKLEKISESDPLTGLYNRRNMYQEIENKLSKSVPVSIAMMDIDDFKTINDKYGHENGDEVLVKVANIIRSNLKNVDLAFRYGGEEFLILIEGDNNAAYQIISKMNEEIINTNFKFGKQNFKITITCGIADSSESTDYTKLIDIADTYLYKGKNSGKAQIIMK